MSKPQVVFEKPARTEVLLPADPEPKANEKTYPSRWHFIAERVASLVQEKNKAYGSSFDQAGDFVRMLWPNGVPAESVDDMLTLVRMFDKVKRIATKKDAFGENPFQDILGYALLALEKAERGGK